MRTLRVAAAVSLTAVIFTAAGCNVAQKILDPVKKERKEIRTKPYEKDGLSFSCPDNWSVTEDEILETGIRHVNAEDADNSLFILSLMSSDSTVDLDDHATTFMKQLPANIPVGKILPGVKNERTARMIGGQNREGVRRKYSVSLMGEVVPHTVDFFFVEGVRSNALITIQTPDEDQKAAEKEIQTIADSLKF